MMPQLRTVRWCQRQTSERMKIGDGPWVPARPWSEGFDIPRRFKLAWRVFRGKYDALDWELDSAVVDAPKPVDLARRVMLLTIVIQSMSSALRGARLHQFANILDVALEEALRDET